jgi:uncharacterized protein (DUF302 family)
MRKPSLLAAALLLASGLSAAADGVITLASKYSVSDTADRLEAVLKKKGMKIFARINHAAGAASVGKKLRPTELVIFGNPKVGTPLMQCAQSVAIDLPQKALISEDANGKVWLSYNDPAYLQRRHHIQGCQPVLTKVSGALAKFARAATQP